MRIDKEVPEQKGKFVSVERMLGSAALEAERVVVAYRKTAFHRFPALFGISVLIGTVATVSGLERILSTVPLFNDHPVMTFVIGLLILAGTGALYKRLSL